MLKSLYYELTFDGRVYATVYNEDDIITKFYDMVNGCGINPNDIVIKAYINGKEEIKA